MFKYWLKNRSIITISITLIASFLVSFVFVGSNIKADAENRLKTSVYVDSEIDYDIPAPTRDQLVDINDLDFVDKVFGYYFTESNLRVNNLNVRTKILFSDWLDNLEITMYNENRLIKSSIEQFSNPIYVDYEFMKNNDIVLGDIIIFNSIEFQVSRIYETNTYYKSAIFAPLVGEQKDYILSLSTSYSGAFIKVNDFTRADTFLRGYKPLGRLKDRSAFDTQEAYDAHYNAWQSANYYNEITSFNEKLNNISIKKTVNIIVGFVVYFILIVGLNLMLMFRKSERKYFHNLKLKKSIKYYYLTNEVASHLIGMGLFIIVLNTLIKQSALFIPGNYLSLPIAGFVITIGITLIINIIVNIIFFNKIILN